MAQEMTREQAIKMIKAKLECFTRETSGVDDECNMHRCDDCELNYAQGNVGEQREWMKIAIKALEQEQRWIPVSEGLPKERGFYLVSTTDCITIMEFINKEWISQNLGSCNWYVKAWQPLPKPYKAEKESEKQ